MLTCELRTILKDKGKIFVRTRPCSVARRLSDNAQNLGGGHYSFSLKSTESGRTAMASPPTAPHPHPLPTPWKNKRS